MTDEIPVCLKHGEPLTFWNGHGYCAVCDARDEGDGDDVGQH